MASHNEPKFLKSLTVTYQGVGATPQDAHDDMVRVMSAATVSYQAGKLFVSDRFSIQNEIDPGGGGPGYLSVADVYLPSRDWAEDHE